jgi:hypothetical protein
MDITKDDLQAAARRTFGVGVTIARNLEGGLYLSPGCWYVTPRQLKYMSNFAAIERVYIDGNVIGIEFKR